MRAVTHNVKVTLDLHQSRLVVAKALASRPQIAAFQEVGQPVADLFGGYTEMYRLCVAGSGPNEGIPVLIRRGYLKSLESVKQLQMAKDFPGGRPTPATEVRFKNAHSVKMAVLNTHPVAHHEKPLYNEAFHEAVRSIEQWIMETKKDGYVPIVLMDGNGVQRLSGLVNCWVGHPQKATGPGNRTIDAIWTIKLAEEVTTFETLSDHNGVLARYSRF